MTDKLPITDDQDERLDIYLCDMHTHGLIPETSMSLRIAFFHFVRGDTLPARGEVEPLRKLAQCIINQLHQNGVHSAAGDPKDDERRKYLTDGLARVLTEVTGDYKH